MQEGLHKKVRTIEPDDVPLDVLHDRRERCSATIVRSVATVRIIASPAVISHRNEAMSKKVDREKREKEEEMRWDRGWRGNKNQNGRIYVIAWTYEKLEEAKQKL